MRRHRASWVILATMGLLACQNTPPVTHKPSAKPAEVQAASAAPGATPSTAATAAGQGTPAPGATPTKAPVALATPGPAQVLVAPKAANVALSGTISIDASYIIAQGAGNVISHNGSAVLQLGGNGVIAAGAGNLIPDASTGVVATQGGAVVATGAGNIIASGGGNVIASGGGNVVSQGAGNVIAQGAGNYKLLADGAASPAPEVGTMLPAAGLLVSAVSLTTHQYVPVGENEKGEPVYVVYSNAEGQYKLFLPKDQVDADGKPVNVMIVASVPGTKDDRSVYNVVTPAVADKPVDIDEDTALAGRFVHFCFQQRMQQFLASTPDQLTSVRAAYQGAVPDALVPLLNQAVAAINDEGRKYHLQQQADTHIAEGISQRAAEILLSAPQLGLDQLYIDPSTAPSNYFTRFNGDRELVLASTTLPDGTVKLGAMADSLKALRLATAAKLKAEPHFFDHLILTFEGDCAGIQDYRTGQVTPVLMPTDTGAFIVKYFLTQNVSSTTTNSGIVYSALGVPYWKPATRLSYDRRVEAGAYAIAAGLIQLLLDPDSPQRKAVLAEIDRGCEAGGLTLVDPSPSPLPTDVPEHPPCFSGPALPNQAPATKPPSS